MNLEKTFNPSEFPQWFEMVTDNCHPDNVTISQFDWGMQAKVNDTGALIAVFVTDSEKAQSPCGGWVELFKL